MKRFLADLGRLATCSRIFIMSSLGTLVMVWPQIADTITAFQPVADLIGRGPQARVHIAIALFVGNAIVRFLDHRSGANPA